MHSTSFLTTPTVAGELRPRRKIQSSSGIERRKTETGTTAKVMASRAKMSKLRNKTWSGENGWDARLINQVGSQFHGNHFMAECNDPYSVYAIGDVGRCCDSKGQTYEDYFSLKDSESDRFYLSVTQKYSLYIHSTHPTPGASDNLMTFKDYCALEVSE